MKIISYNKPFVKSNREKTFKKVKLTNIFGVKHKKVHNFAI